MKYDLHVHSKYSRDSLMSPEQILKVAKKRGLDGIAITDHHTIKGGLEAQKINRDRDFTVIVGTEIKTEYDDVIGLFLHKEIESRGFFEVINEIRCQGGLVGLPHPYRKYRYPETIVNWVDFIEGFNARSRKLDNDRAYRLASISTKPMSAGSDAHFSFEIGNGIVICDVPIRKALTTPGDTVQGKESNYYIVHGCSFMAEKMKNALARPKSS